MKRIRDYGLCGWMEAALAACLLFAGQGARAAEAPADDAAHVLAVEGVVEVSHDGGQTWSAVARGATLPPGSALRVGARGRAALRLPDHTVLRLDQFASVRLAPPENRRPVLELLKGAAYFFSRTPRTLTIKTPYVNGTIEGTEFLVQVSDQDGRIAVFEGTVLAANAAGELRVSSGEAAVARVNVAPAREVLVRPDDAVAWALYYPPVLAAPAGEGALTDTVRAAQLLAVGRADEAAGLLNALRGADAQGAAARALAAAIAVARNERDQALALAEEALRLDPQSTAAHVALSYACQARFELDRALATMEAAVNAQPGDALAWARLAELRLATGRRAAAIAAADRAAELAGNIERLHTVRGFAHLAATDVAHAREAFTAAIALDQGAPLPRLGLGLAEIRAGNLAAGRAELETAVALSPRDALLRSYLGKAYLEERRDAKGEAQLAQARALDPNDPTPYLYDAVRAQAANDPVGALQQLAAAQARNDNRAVYRSRLLLDEDLATRGVGLARTYQDLGFERRALVEGRNALAHDPANYSAHRFLADTYAAQPNSEIAHASELLVAQLLQPINTLPVQPGLGERRPAAIGGVDTLAPAFNEYSDLFVADGLHGLLSGVVGEHDTYGNEAIGSVQEGPYSVSIGQLYETTDGYRENQGQRLESYNVFGQAALSPDANVQAEFRTHDRETGDLGSMILGPAAFSPTLNDRQRQDALRVGGHYAASPALDILASAVYQTLDQDSTDTTPVGLPPGSVTAGSADADSSMGEVQAIAKSARAQVVFGGGYFHEDTEEIIVFRSDFLDSTVNLDETVRHANAYGYSYIDVPGHVLLTLGLSADNFEGAPRDVSQWNPKTGLQWRPLPDTEVRLAAFRTLTRSLVFNQTIEPTLVAGFRQFADDVNATEAWQYGIGLDQRLGDAVLAGVETTYRTPEIPTQMLTPTGEFTLQMFDAAETRSRAYGYWMPSRRAALSAEYHYDRVNPDGPSMPFALDSETHRVPLGCRLFLPGGWMPQVQVAFVDQTGLYPDPMTGESVRQGDRFWVVDAGVGYRLPRRRGTLSLEGRNLFDESFRYTEMDPEQPVTGQERMLLARMTLAY